jgi:hypothetical protein
MVGQARRHVVDRAEQAGGIGVGQGEFPIQHFRYIGADGRCGISGELTMNSYQG